MHSSNDTTPPIKTCSKCGETKTLPNFSKDAQKRDGLRPYCKECDRAAHRLRPKNPEKQRAANRRWYAAHRESALAASRAWHASHPECKREWNAANLERRREYTRQWRAKNPEKQKESRRATYQRRREHNISKARAWTVANQDRANAQNRAAYARNPAFFAAKNHYRRALSKNAPGIASAESIMARWAMWGGLCYMCGAPATCTDHVVALTRGGSNWPANLRPACRSCNASKSNKDWHPFVSR